MNRRSRRPSAAVALGALLALAPLPAAAQNSFTVTELALPIGNDPHPAGGYARAINASHQVVGNAYIDRYQVTPSSYIVRPLGVYWDAMQSPATLFQETYPDRAFASVAYGINDAGTIAGVETSDQGAASFLYSAGHYLFLESPNSNGFVNALNNSDQSAGVFYNSDNTTSAVAWDAVGKAVLLAPPGGSSAARAINDKGLVVGATNTRFSDPPTQPFVRTKTLGASLLPVGSSIGGGALAVNNAGDVAGYLETQFFHAADHAAVWHNGIGMDIQSLGLTSHAVGINDAGQVIGALTLDTSGTGYAFYYANGAMQLLLNMIDESFPYKYLRVEAISQDGSIVGEATNSPFGFNTHPVLLTPSQAIVPHPAEAIDKLTIHLAAGAVYDPVTRLWVRTATLTNHSTSVIPGPFNIVLAIPQASRFYAVLPPGGILLANTPLGTAYSRYAISGNSLAPGASVTIGVSFSLPALRYGTDFTINHVFAGPGRP